MKIHFIGIGGIGMSALARMFLLEGKEVTGSDLSPSFVTSELEKHGARISYTQDASNISSDIDMVIYTVAIADTHSELVAARAHNIPTHSYPEMLGILSKEKFTIAVSGTHGKTTTTAMIAQVLMDAGLDPTVIVGSFLLGAQSNFIAGKSTYLVVEACEYKRSFLNLHPNVLVITNIEDDHLDYYKDTADIQSAFAELADRVPKEGYVVCEPKHAHVAPVIENVSATVLDYTSAGEAQSITLAGDHNKKNAAAALVVASILGIPPEKAVASLNTFKGTWRRFEKKGTTTAGALVYDDYAHHPTEIEATLSMTRELYPDKKIVVVFQPHLYSRTKDHLEAFAHAFTHADKVLLAPIYAAREAFDPSISSDILASRINATRSGIASSHASFDDIKKELSVYTDDTIIVVMGAGDITNIASELVV